MSSNDYVKYVTQQVVSYLDKSKEEREKARQQEEQNGLPYSNRWLGVIPFAVMTIFKRKRKK